MNRWLTIPLLAVLGLAGASRLPAQGRMEVALWHAGDRAAGDPAAADNLAAARHALTVAGVPFRVTDSLAEASGSAVVLIAPPLAVGVLLPAERQLLAAYLAGGGVVVAAAVSDPDLLPLFGLASPLQVHNRPALSWAMESGDPVLRWFDDPLEQTITLGDPATSLMMTSTGYRAAGAAPLARYGSDQSVAAAKNAVGSGTAYSLGVAWAEVILLGQLSRDHNAQRSYTNGFEPTADTLMLLVRAVFQTHVPHACWKPTAPAGYRGALIITHDVDSRSAFPFVAPFARMEGEQGARATYNVTTSYVHDERFGGYGNYYDAAAVVELKKVLNLGGRIGSHTVGHFLDFDSIPVGAPGNTRANYTPWYDETAAHSVGATLTGELEVSRDLLQADLGVPVTAFRSGHLLFHDQLANVMQDLGYRIDSSLAAANALTNFPFRLHADRLASGAVTDVLEIGLNMSDVYDDQDMDEGNKEAKLLQWRDVLSRLAANGSPCVLLIHPNRTVKLEAEQELLEQMPDDIWPIDMESYASFWLDREAFAFGAALSGGTLQITVPDRLFPLSTQLGLVVDNGQDLAAIELRRANGETVPVIRRPWGGRDELVCWGLSLEGGRFTERAWKVSVDVARLTVVSPGGSGGGRTAIYRRAADGGAEVKVAEVAPDQYREGRASVLDYPLATGVRYTYRAVIAGTDGAPLLTSAGVTL